MNSATPALRQGAAAGASPLACRQSPANL